MRTIRPDGSLVPGGASDLFVGNLLARAYHGAWRSSPPALDLAPEELGAIMPHLIEVNGVGLVWPRLRHRAEEYGAIGMPLEYGYQQQVDWNEGASARVVAAVEVIRSVGIEPILIKGWTISRRYPAPAVRLAGDIDLVVRTEEYERAKLALKASDGFPGRLPVDLHHDGNWIDLPDSEFRDRTTFLEVGGGAVRVLSPEDELYVLCYHFMRHGGFRPLWLCDVALALETRPVTFDWDRFLARPFRQCNWLITCLGLAHAVLGASIGDTPVAHEVRLPKWLVPAVMRRWIFAESTRKSVMAEVGSHAGWSAFTRHRWPDPLGATVYLRLPFGRYPPLPVQWMAFLHRAATYGLPGLARSGVIQAKSRMRPV